MPFGLVAVDIAGGGGLGGHVFRIHHADFMTCLLAPRPTMTSRPAGVTSCDSRVPEDSYECRLDWWLSILLAVGALAGTSSADIMTCLLAPQANYDFETGGSHFL